MAYYEIEVYLRPEIQKEAPITSGALWLTQIHNLLKAIK